MANQRAAMTGTTPQGCCTSVLGEPLDETQARDLARAFAALADPVRLRILGLIAEAGEVCSCELIEPLGKAQPTVSHHTKILAEAGLITGDKRGRWVWWQVERDRLAELKSTLDPERALRPGTAASSYT